jgi:hypothetical protein
MTTATLGAYIPDGLADDLAIHPVRAKVIQKLIHHFCFKEQSWLTAGGQFDHRLLDWSLLLPYATYNTQQLFVKLRQMTIDDGFCTLVYRLSAP